MLTAEKLKEFKSCEHQSWSATGYLSLLLYGLAGINIENEYISFSPNLYNKVSKLKVTNVFIGQCNFDITITGEGSKIISININGKKAKETRINTSKQESFTVEIIVESE